MAASNIALDVRELSCGYAQKTIIDSASFTVSKGDFACIIGSNGCGKTTLLKTVLGLLPAKGGSAYIEGQDICNLQPKERARLLSYIPQAHTPPFPYSVSDIVLMGRTPHIGNFSHVSKEDKKIVWDALCLLGIEKLANHSYTRLSGGQQQLCLIARAVAQDAKVIIMDEPTANLDFGNQQMVLNRMKNLSDSGATLLMVTHDPHHALFCANKVIVVKDGSIRKTGTPEDIITKETLEEIYHTPIDVQNVMGSDNKLKRVCIPL